VVGIEDITALRIISRGLKEKDWRCDGFIAVAWRYSRSMKKVAWRNRAASDEEVCGLAGKLGLLRPVAAVLTGRGVASEGYDSFVNPRLSSLSDPFDLDGVESASERLWAAVSRREKIVVFGDYDTDGITSSVLLSSVLKENGADVATFLPHRFDDGYGFSPETFEKMSVEHAPNLVVTVDCGMDGAGAVEAARSQGVDVVVTDHHEPGAEPPGALAVVNPKLADDDRHGLSTLSGVGVAFKLCHGFLKMGRATGLGGATTDLKTFLDLVALGTVADVVPLVGENRAMVASGLRVLGSQARPGVRALCESANLGGDLRPANISFKLAPKLNAAGRFGDPDEAFKILATDDIVEAYRIAAILDDYNHRRKEIEGEVFDAAVEMVETGNAAGYASASLVAGDGWHQGVLGIVASKLMEKYNRPALVLSVENDTARGSGRSVDGVDLVEALSGISDILSRFGGHAMAAGVTLPSSRVSALFKRFDAVAGEMLANRSKPTAVDYDGEIQISEIDDAFFEQMKKLEPFGCGNPEPVFRFNRLSPEWVKPAAERHSRGRLRDPSGESVGFIAFGREVSTLPEDSLWDVLGKPSINTFHGESNLQIQIVDVRPSA